MKGGCHLEYELQAIAVVSWLLLIFFLQISLWPWLRKALSEFAYPASFPASILLFTLLSWYCGLFRIPVQATLVPFAIMFIVALYQGKYTRENCIGQGKWVLVFLVFFLFMLEVRFVNPSISYAEKFMDHAFLASIMRIPVVPPLDPWFLGGTLDVYYYLGYWTFGAMGIASGVPSNITFNLALPTVMGLMALGVYAAGHLLTDRFRWIVLLPLLIVNPSFIWQAVQGKALGAILWDSTRTIPNTINEYPIFSFLWGDVHAHVIGMFNQAFLVLMLLIAWKRWRMAGSGERWTIALLVALSLGSMPLINSWDVIVYAPVTLLFGFIIWYEQGFSGDVPAEGIAGVARHTWDRVSRASTLALSRLRRRGEPLPAPSPAWFMSRSWAFFVGVPIISVIIYFPFYLQMNSPGIQGIGIVHTPTGPAEFMLVHGIFLSLFIIYLASDIRRKPVLLLISVPFALAGYFAAAVASIPLIYFLARKRRDPAELLAVVGIIVIILCEFFFLKDNMGDTYYRMNTLFKFYVAAWILMGVSSFAMLAAMLSRLIQPGAIPAGLARGAGALAIILLLCAPLAIPLDSPYRGATLDGLAYLRSAHPGDAEAVAYLRSLPGTTGIVEAEGGDYTYFSRISSFTGIPSIIGMPFHEYMWRNSSDGWYGQRLNDIRAIYEEPSRTKDLMARYQATLLYVGDSERDRYAVRVEEAGLRMVYNRSGVQIYALDS